MLSHASNSKIQSDKSKMKPLTGCADNRPRPSNLSDLTHGLVKSRRRTI